MFSGTHGIVAHLCHVTALLKDEVNSSLPKGISYSEKCCLDIMWQLCYALLMLHISDINRALKKQRERKSAAKRKLQKLQIYENCLTNSLILL